MTVETKIKEMRDRYQSSLIGKRELGRELGGISVPTIDRMRKRGIFRGKKVGGQIRFSIDDIALYLVEEL